MKYNFKLQLTNFFIDKKKLELQYFKCIFHPVSEKIEDSNKAFFWGIDVFCSAYFKFREIFSKNYWITLSPKEFFLMIEGSTN